MLCKDTTAVNSCVSLEIVIVYFHCYGMQALPACPLLLPPHCQQVELACQMSSQHYSGPHPVQVAYPMQIKVKHHYHFTHKCMAGAVGNMACWVMVGRHRSLSQSHYCSALSLALFA